MFVPSAMAVAEGDGLRFAPTLRRANRHEDQGLGIVPPWWHGGKWIRRHRNLLHGSKEAGDDRGGSAKVSHDGGQRVDGPVGWAASAKNPDRCPRVASGGPKNRVGRIHN